jgi:hypothetical protein
MDIVAATEGGRMRIEEADGEAGGATDETTIFAASTIRLRRSG